MKYLGSIILLLLMYSCGGGYDDGFMFENQNNYAHYVKFADTNLSIESIRYPQVNRIDTVNTKLAKLTLSDNFPTIIEVNGGQLHYRIKLNTVYQYKESEGSTIWTKNYTKVYKGLEILESNAIEARIEPIYIQMESHYREQFTNDVLILK